VHRNEQLDNAKNDDAVSEFIGHFYFFFFGNFSTHGPIFKIFNC